MLNRWEDGFWDQVWKLEDGLPRPLRPVLHVVLYVVGVVAAAAILLMMIAAIVAPFAWAWSS